MGNSWKIKGLPFMGEATDCYYKEKWGQKFWVREKIYPRFSDHNILYNTTIPHTK